MNGEKNFDAENFFGDKENRRLALEKMLAAVDKKYLNQENLKKQFLSERLSGKTGGIDIADKLDLVDALRNNIQTALDFGDFRRASRYFVTLYIFCENFFRKRDA